MPATLSIQHPEPPHFAEKSPFATLSPGPPRNRLRRALDHWGEIHADDFPSRGYPASSQNYIYARTASQIHLPPRLSLLIPFLSLWQAALYKEEEKGKRNYLGALGVNHHEAFACRAI
jgi:hypothetical protein